MKTALLCIFILMFSPLTYSQWVRTNGPEGISINSLLTVGDTLYAGTATDGAYASTDGGVNWFPMNSGIETKGILSLASNPYYLYAGTDGYGVYRSSDRGQTWQSPSNEKTLYVTSLAVKESYVFAGSEGIYFSSDKGRTWTNINFSYEIFNAMCVDGDKIFASEFNYTIVSTNNGANWSYVDDLTGSAGFSLYCNGNIIMAGGRSEVFRSTDHGNSFVEIPINFNYSIVNIYAITEIGSTLFAATSYDGVYKSTDNGSTWAPANIGMGPKNVYALAVADSSSLIAGAHYAGMFRSTNEGASWNRSMSGLPAGSTISGLYSSGSTVFAGTYDGVFRSTDNGLNWNKLTTANDTVNYSHVRGICMKGDTLFAGTIFHFHSTVYRSADSGTTWEWSGNGFPSDLSFINYLIVSGNNILAATGEGIYYTSNNGDNWIQANSPIDDVPNIAKSGVYEYAPYPLLGSVYRSVDDGQDWSLVAYTGTDYTVISARENFACTGSFFEGALVSDNYGIGWTQASGISSDISVFSVYYVPNSSLVLASADVSTENIFNSTDNGFSYSPYSEGLGPNAIPECFTATDSFLIAGTDYNGVWRRLRPELVTSISHQNDVPKTYNLEQNYPNPFNPETKINYSIPKAGFVSLKIYDMLGREVSVLVDEVKQPGKYSVVWDAVSFASGIYFYKLTSEQFASTKKMILIK